MGDKNKERRQKIFKAAEKFKSQGSKKEKGFRVVITGKGGAGKTTLTAILSKLLAGDGYNVLAVDEDPQINLPYSLGFSPDREITPASRNLDYIEEKTGARPGEGWGVMLTLNPDVSDVVERFGIKTDDGINLLVMGSVIQAATGCLCPENALLEAVMSYISLREGEIILMDTQAGVEHFGRALARGFKQAVIITEPTFNAYQVALHAAKLSRQLGIPYVHLAVNKIRKDKDFEKFKKTAGEGLRHYDELFILPFDEEILLTEPDVTPLLEGASPYMREVTKIADALKMYGEK